MEKSDKLEKYEVVRLPDPEWWAAGEELVLDESLMQALVRCGEWRLVYQRPSYGLVLLYGLPGTGKSVTARFAADALVRRFCGRGNGLVVNAAALLNEHLGRSQQIVSELFAEITLSASRVATIVIWDDAESVLVSRKQVIKTDDPTDLLKVTTALNKGIDDLKRVSNVLQLCTCNLTDILDDAIKSRMRVRLHFPLPSDSQRREIIRRQVNGLAGERVLDELVAATDGWSGRDLAGIAELAFIYGTGSPEALSAADFLRAVGLTPGNGAGVENGKTAASAQPETPVRTEQREENDPCQSTSRNGSSNGYQQAGIAQMSKYPWPMELYAMRVASSHMRPSLRWRTPWPRQRKRSQQ